MDEALPPIERLEGEVALAAFARCGKRRGHPAKLSIGGCFAYAAARVAGCAPLFRGHDFRHTDIVSALNQA